MRRLALAVAFVAALSLANPSPAYASCSGAWCSRVYNQRTSAASVLVAAQWQTTTYNSSAKATIRPGATSSDYLRDVNAVWVPTGCTASSSYGTIYGGRWFRPAAGVYYVLTVRC